MQKDFEDFDTEDGDYTISSLMSALPEKYEMDYLVYSASDSFREENIIWHSDYVDVVKRMLFKKFDSWVEHNYLNRDRNG